MAALLLIVAPALFFTLVGRATAPARTASEARSLRGAGADFMRGLRGWTMYSPQFVPGSAR